MNLVSLVFLERVVPRVLKEKEVKREKQAPPVLLVLLALKVHQVMMDLKVALVQLVFLVILAPLENLAQLVKMVPQVTKVMMVNLVRLDLLAQLENQAHQVPRGRGVLLVQQVLKEDKERKEPRVNLVWKDLLGRQVLLVPRELQGNLVPMAFEEFLAQWVNKGSPVPQAPMVLQAHWAHLVYLVLREIRVLKVKRVIPV